MKITNTVIIILAFVFFGCTTEKSKDVDEKSIEFDLPENFVLDELYQPSEHKQGSWVALAQGPNEIIYACDQYGKIYYFKAPEIDGVLESEDVHSLPLQIGEAHGLLWAFNSLYVSVNKGWSDDVPDDEENGSGVYRITDTDNDGELDKIDMLLKLNGAGEHGPHSLVLSPDEKELYFIAGNHTLVPESLLRNSRLPINWQEDNLFTPYLDARGHANDIKAPGGWIAKFDPEGTSWELISAGYRNPFDMAFNQDGELFTYDADMEWDIGMPWYRPTRICHVTSGSEYGWRTGSGKWPDNYPDALPAVHNMNQGSPTAVLSGAALNFPAKYQNGLFLMDWSFGTLYFAELRPNGSSYSAQRTEFLSGTPLPLTDMIAGNDGHLYFATGGRRLRSHLYRLRYTGPDKSESQKVQESQSSALRKLRKDIEKYHTQLPDEAVPLAWTNLDHDDRFIRYAARIALENQATTNWQHLFFKEKNQDKLIEAAIALARQANKELQSKIINKLLPIRLEELTSEKQIDLLRAYELLFIRMGAPNEADRSRLVEKLDSHFPHTNNSLNRELGQLLLYLKADGIVERLVQLLEKYTQDPIKGPNGFLPKETTLRSEQYGPLIREITAKMPPAEAIYYGVLLSHAEEGWSKEARSTYFQWFYDVLNSKGGLSFKPGMENIRLAAMEHVPKEQKAYFQELSGVYSPSTAIADLPQPIGPGNQYKGSDMGELIWGSELADYKSDYSKGERAFKAGMCVLCHRVRGEGGAVGSDLTQVSDKFSSYDLLFAIYSPNDEISDQYANTLFHLNDGKKLSGRIKSENEEIVILMPNPFNEGYTVDLVKTDIIKRELSPLSPMPSGLLNRLNPKEIKDLFVYLEAGGDPNHKVYKDN